MSYDPVEGIHYIFDRYAFLNSVMEDGNLEHRITQQSAQEDIEFVIKRARAIHHPDRQANAGKNNQQQAEHMTHLIVDCEKILTNPDARDFYNRKLEQFREERPHLVSSNGVALIDLSSGFFDVTSLMSDEVADTQRFEDLIKAHLRYDEAKFQQMKTLRDTMPDNAQISDLYRGALTEKFIYFTFLEDAAWAKIGYQGIKQKTDGVMTHADQYLEKVEEKARTMTTRNIEDHVEGHGEAVRIGLAPLPLLLSFNHEAAPASGALVDPVQLTEALAKMKEKALQNFEIRMEYVRDVARQKQEVLEELVTLSPVETLRERVAGEPMVDVYLVEPPAENGSQRAVLRITSDAARHNLCDIKMFTAGETLAEVRQISHAYGSYAVTRNMEISDPLLEVVSAYERLLKKEHAPSATPAAKSQGPKL